MSAYELAFSSLGCPGYTVEQIAEAARAYGYAAVSLRTVRNEPMLTSLPEFSAEGLPATRACFDAAGVCVLCVASGVRFTDLTADERAAQARVAEDYIRIAAGLGAPYVRIFGGPLPASVPRGTVMEWIVEGFRNACDVAARAGVSVLFETHDDFSRGADAAALVRAVARGNLFIVWDVLHSIRYGESLQDTWRHAGHLVRHVHLKDATAWDQTSFSLALLGRGKIPLRAAVDLLRGAGYAGVWEFEWEKGWHQELPGPEIALPHGAGYLGCLLGEPPAPRG